MVVESTLAVSPYVMRVPVDIRQSPLIVRSTWQMPSRRLTKTTTRYDAYGASHRWIFTAIRPKVFSITITSISWCMRLMLIVFARSASSATSGVLDDIRSSVWNSPIIILNVHYDSYLSPFLDVIHWNPPRKSSTGFQALTNLEAIIDQGVRFYVFGEPVTTDKGVSSIHQNQGDPIGSITQSALAHRMLRPLSSTLAALMDSQAPCETSSAIAPQ